MTAGVYAACMELRDAVSKRLGLNAADAQFAGGQVLSGGRAIPLATAAKAGPVAV